jgi:2-amino-4-hydroxy-6-hydroxymethyldihydropteridine diphosphokinase
MQYYLSIGSNLGNRLAFLQFSINELKKYATIENVSNIYETQAIGFETENLFLNACLQLKCSLPPLDLLAIIHEIESSAGRVRLNDGYYHSRPLDIDIIYCDDLILSSEKLTIPHPKYTERKFVLLPLNELSMNLIDPLSKTPLKSLLQNCCDTSKVEPLELMLFI